MFVATLVFCCWKEPVLHDGWNHYFDLQRRGLSWSDVIARAWHAYHHGNPRLGQMVLYPLYEIRLHVWLTPSVIVATILASCYLVQGRWPSLRDGRDWTLVGLVTALLLVMVFNIGPMLFYRPYVSNYVYGFSLYLALLVPYRKSWRREDSPSPVTKWRAAGAAGALALLGAVAGLTNEHTGPAVIVGLGVYCVARLRRGRRLEPWMVAGWLGVVIGYAALYLAPGQMVRYEGAGQVPALQVIAARGAWANLGVLALGLLPAGVALPLFAISRRAPVGPRCELVLWFAAVSLMMSGLLLASPKLGLRLYWASTLLLVVAVATWFSPRLLTARALRSTAASTACLILLHCLKLVTVYHHRAGEFAHRMERLRSAHAGDALRLPCYTPRSGRWTVADDLPNVRTRDRWLTGYGLREVRPTGEDCRGR
ncbi:MAG: hypothetical protein IPI49_25650 [Myxococcales bacterium]|nr:hypothetical protein [Myxococcales bacterium]